MFPVAGCNPVVILSRVATRGSIPSRSTKQIRSRSINGDAVDCKSAAFGHAWFDPRILHQTWAVSDNGSTWALHVSGRGSIPRRSTKLWSCHIVAIIPACLVGYRGSIPRRIASFGGSRGLRVCLASILSSGVRYPRPPPI